MNPLHKQTEGRPPSEPPRAWLRLLGRDRGPGRGRVRLGRGQGLGRGRAGTLPLRAGGEGRAQCDPLANGRKLRPGLGRVSEVTGSSGTFGRDRACRGAAGEQPHPGGDPTGHTHTPCLLDAPISWGPLILQGLEGRAWGAGTECGFARVGLLGPRPAPPFGRSSLSHCGHGNPSVLPSVVSEGPSSEKTCWASPQTAGQQVPCPLFLRLSREDWFGSVRVNSQPSVWLSG